MHEDDDEDEDHYTGMKRICNAASKHFEGR